MQHRIALVGKSVGLISIGAGLANSEDLEVVRFSGPPGDVAPWIDTVAPEAVILDMAAPGDFSVLSSLRRPGLLLIGFDLFAHEMVIVSGEQVELSTSEDLLRVLARHHLCDGARDN